MTSNEPVLSHEDRLRYALEVAVKLWDVGIRGPEGCAVLGLAVGIYLEADEAISRGMVAHTTDAVGDNAQRAFDTFRLMSTREAGNA